MDEIFRLTDRITVFKNGALMKTLLTKETRLEEIVSLMTDNWLSNKLKSSHQIGEEALVVDGIHTRDNVVKAGSFTVHRGEILGIFGLGGSGRTELLEGVYGFRTTESGKVTIDKKPYQKRSPNESIKRGMVLISEDRRGKALVSSLSVKSNITLSKIDDYSNYGVMNQKKEIDDVEDKINSIGIKTKGNRQKVSELSGGNQQKVVFAKSLLTNPIIYLCDEPTQAVDIRTREEIHNLLREKAQEGNAVVFVSSDLKEILDVADNIQIIREGRTTVLLHNENLSSEDVLSHCYAG
jgi:ribose transport system ATP-binding protein